MSIVIKTELQKLVGFHKEPPFLSFLVKVQFQSPPMIRFDNSDLSMIKLSRF